MYTAEVVRELFRTLPMRSEAALSTDTLKERHWEPLK